MLQINSGKLYPGGVRRTNQLRGVIYTNLFIGERDVPLVTAAGTSLYADPFGSLTPLIYELTEQMDDDRIAPGVLVSHGVQAYMNDFAAVVSFVLRATCTPDADLCTRLLSGKRSLGVSTPPSKLVSRVFKSRIFIQRNDRELLTSFVTDLIALRRRSFLAAMRAIRTYMTGLHRVADDLELAYTLLVASIEYFWHRALKAARGNGRITRNRNEDASTAHSPMPRPRRLTELGRRLSKLSI